MAPSEDDIGPTATAGCWRHRWDPSVDSCRSCHASYCARCLVYVQGPSRPPICIQCALDRSGVQPGVRPPTQGFLERRRRRRIAARARSEAQRAVEVQRERALEEEPRHRPVDEAGGDATPGSRSPGWWAELDGTGTDDG